MDHHMEGHFQSAAQPERPDPRDLPTGTSSLRAVELVEEGLQAMLSYFGDPIQFLESAAAEAPDWGHPRVLLASLLLTMGEEAPARRAAEELAAAAVLPRGVPRERAHAAAAQAAVGGDWDRACQLWDAILIQWPRDVAALLFAHLFDFYRGDALNLKRRPQRVLPYWTQATPLYGYVVGMHAFGLEESGHYAEAEDAGRAALEINRRDPWAVHAVTHVMEMQGRHHAGARWLQSREADWAVDNGFAFHNWFHAALFQLEDMDIEGALATYDTHLATATEIALQRVDGTAVLWRLHLLGVDVRSRFRQMLEAWNTSGHVDGYYAFSDVHAAMARIGAGLEAPPPVSPDTVAGSTNRRMTSVVGAPLQRALQAYAESRWSDAQEILLQVRDEAHVFGGSHAQRDILTWTLVDAACRGGNSALAHHVLNERVPAKAATPLTVHWRSRAG